MQPATRHPRNTQEPTFGQSSAIRRPVSWHVWPPAPEEIEEDHPVVFPAEPDSGRYDDDPENRVPCGRAVPDKTGTRYDPQRFVNAYDRNSHSTNRKVRERPWYRPPRRDAHQQFIRQERRDGQEAGNSNCPSSRGSKPVPAPIAATGRAVRQPLRPPHLRPLNRRKDASSIAPAR